MAFEFVQSAINDRQKNGLFRSVTPVSENYQSVIKFGSQHMLNFAGNDYLGLSQHPDILQAYAEGLSLYGASSSASPLVCGYHSVHQQLEEMVAELTQQPAAILFSSGYAANQAICFTLSHPTPANTSPVAIIADKLMHASFIEAATRCQDFARFQHNNFEHAETLINQRENRDLLIASEGVFSMDGDGVSLSELLALKTKFSNAWLMLDQAHALGVIGEHGCGLKQANNYQHLDVVMGTFGKALGTQGAFVSGSQLLIDYLRNFARHYVYSTAMAPAIANATITAIQRLTIGAEQERLQQVVYRFKQLSEQHDLNLMPSESAIQPMIIGNSKLLISAADQLQSLGVLVGAIRSPTVPKGKERLRITLSASHSDKDIQALIDALCIVRDKLKFHDTSTQATGQ